MTTATITRRSTVGFGYTSACENDERGNMRVCETTAPVHTGTILKVYEMINEDRTLASYRGGTFYTSAWFVKINGQWRKVNNTDENNWELNRLVNKSPNRWGEMEYMADAVTVEVK